MVNWPVKLSSSSPEQLPARKLISAWPPAASLASLACIGRRCAVMEKAQIAGSGLSVNRRKDWASSMPLALKVTSDPDAALNYKKCSCLKLLSNCQNCVWGLYWRHPIHNSQLIFPEYRGNNMLKHGFELVEERKMPEVDGTARFWRHRKTGAQLLSVCNGDENKCFGVSFCTPPTDSTGIAHILEHSVLCGSKKYPVKEPFAELLKGSLQTFLNAFTFPDKTCYPVASANLRDFYNLIDVYLDAVFYPLLTEDTFRQEGWHVDAENVEDKPVFRGVVYNEMKGVYSSPDSVLAEQSQQAMFPDNLYSLDSGGNPEDIPNLTYQAFVDFHRRYYQPGNARFFFWGDDDEDASLERLASELDKLESLEPPAPIPLQKPFAEQRFLEVPYAAAEGRDKASFTLNWLLPERGDIARAIKLDMLEHILEGLPGSPLRRALIESGLGEDTAGCGLEGDLRQMYYSTGLKNIDPAAVPRARELIFGVLRDLSEKGIDPAAVEASVNTIEFALRENNTGRFPRGIAAMVQALSTWLYGCDPLAALSWEGPLKQIKDDMAAGKKIFEDAIREYFLENRSLAQVTLLPDDKLAAAREKGEKCRLAALWEEAGVQGREKLVSETARLRDLQSREDSPEALATIPALSVADLPRKITRIPIQVEKDEQTFIFHDLPTRGIAYTAMLMPVKRIPARLLPMLPLFCRAFSETGTRKSDFASFGMRMAAKTGGIGAATTLGETFSGRQAYCWLSIAGKAVYDKLEDFFNLVGELLLEPQDKPQILAERLLQMALEDKARLEYGLQAAGHATVAMRLRARYTGLGAISEMLGGVTALQYLRDLTDRLMKNPESVLADYDLLRRCLISADGAIFDCVGNETGNAAARKCAAELFAQLPKTPLAEGEAIDEIAPIRPANPGEAWITPAQVNYVGLAANLYDMGYKYKGSASVIMRWLRMGRLWEEVRMRQGAYGVSASLDRIGGTMLMTSYRDPGVDGTLASYKGTAEYLRNFTPTKAQLSQAIIGCIGDIDAYMLPDAKGARALTQWLSGRSDESRQQARDEILSTTAADFREFADVIAAAVENPSICVLGGEKAARAAAAHGWSENNLL